MDMKRKILMALAIPLLIAAGFLTYGCATSMASEKEPGYRFVAAWGERGIGPGEFNDPTGIAVTEHEVFVSDARNSRIQVFDFDGNFELPFGAPDKAPSQLGPHLTLTIGHIVLYVADYWNDRIEVFALDGQHQRTIGHSGSGPG